MDKKWTFIRAPNEFHRDVCVYLYFYLYKQFRLPILHSVLNDEKGIANKNDAIIHGQWSFAKPNTQQQHNEK